jgi:hypothetical protein
MGIEPATWCEEGNREGRWDRYGTAISMSKTGCKRNMRFKLYFEFKIQILNLFGIPVGILGYRGNRESRAPSRNFFIREPKSWYVHREEDVQRGRSRGYTEWKGQLYEWQDFFLRNQRGRSPNWTQFSLIFTQHHHLQGVPEGQEREEEITKGLKGPTDHSSLPGGGGEGMERS